MTFNFCTGAHSLKVAVRIQDCVHFDAGLGCSELGPGEQGQAEVDDRCATAEQFVFKMKYVFWRVRKAPHAAFT